MSEGRSKPPKPLQFGQEVELTVESLAFGGEGVARMEGFTVFVPGALPGERVVATAREVKDRWARAELKSVLTPSPHRIAPTCPIFHECGGCQWQHLDYSRQLVAKRSAVAESLERIGRLSGVTVQPCLPSPQSYQYRNKALPVVSMRSGHFISGIFEPRSHHLVPYVTCPIQTDPINQVIQKALLKAEQAGLTPYQPKSHTGFLRHLVVRHGVGTGELMLAFVTREPAPSDRLTRPTVVPEPPEQVLPRIAAELAAEIPNLVSVLQNLNPARTHGVLGAETRVLAGQGFFHETFDGLTLQVSLPSFVQVNTHQAGILHAVVREALGRPQDRKRWGTVLDLYGGIGTLALAVSDSAEYVLGVEEVAAAVEDARENARLNHKRNLDFIVGDAAATLLKLKDQGLVGLDAVILDPPRRGVPPELLARVTALRPERLVYVSCDPATLARDLALLVQHGYAVDWVQPLDMFPQTYHVESVARLTRTVPLSTEVVPGVTGARPVFRLPPADSTGTPSTTQRLSKGFGEAWKILARAVVMALSAFRQAMKPHKAQPVQPPEKVFAESLPAVETPSAVLPTEIETPVPHPVEEEPRRAWSIPTEERPAYSEGDSIPGMDLTPTSALPLESPVEATIQPSPAAAIVSSPKPLGAEGPVSISGGQAEDPIPDGSGAPAGPPPQAPPAIPGREGFSFRKLWTSPVRTALVLAAFLAAVFSVRATFLPSHGSGNWAIHTTPDLVPELPTGNLRRYELPTFGLRLGRDAKVSADQITARAEVFREGNPVETVAGIRDVILKSDGTGHRLSAHWPIPFNAPAGTYIVRMTVHSPRMTETKTFESAFTLAPLSPHWMPPGYTALTLEGGIKAVAGKYPPPDGEGSDSPAQALDWAQFLGADAFLFLAGQTSVWSGFHLKEFPFSPWMLRLSDQYARAAHEKGIKYGVYLTTFRVVGDAWQEAPYRFALGYDREADKLKPIDFISLKDTTRLDDLVGILKKFQNDDGIDLIGFDYIRTGEGGYEWVDDFVSDFNLETPPGFKEWPPEERSLWLARRIERDQSTTIRLLFEWWRAHKVAETLKDLLARARVTKPVFTFTLGWQMGHQHGQDPAMYIDAGVGVNNIMLYQRARGQVEEMKVHWPPYLAKGNGMYVLGEMVDFNWVQKSLSPPGPEELFDRETETFANWFPVNASLGMYWHDLYRLVYGAKGPYTSVEWAFSGGKAFSFLRQAENVSPILTKIDVPREIPAGVPFTFSVEILNRSGEDLKGLTLLQYDPSKETLSVLSKVGPFSLPAGHKTRISNLVAFTPKEPHPERDNRWMVAVVVQKPGSRETRAFDFAYVKALTSEEAQQRLDVVKAYRDRMPEEKSSGPVISRPVLDNKLLEEAKRLEAQRTAESLKAAAAASVPPKAKGLTLSAAPPAAPATILPTKAKGMTLSAAPPAGAALAPLKPERAPASAKPVPDFSELLKQVPVPDF